MSHIATFWAWKQEVAGTAKFVLLALADYHNSEDGGCFPSLGTLAARCCLAENTVRSAIDTLALAGLVEKTSRTDAKGRSRSNQYRLLIDEEKVGSKSWRGEGANSGPLEPVIYNQDTIPSELEDPVLSIFANHEEPPESSNKTFWDEAVGMLMGMGVADVTARTFVGRCLKLTNGDQTEILRVMEAALAAGVRDPIPYLSAALGGKKKKETVVKNKAIADAFAALEAESEKRKAQWAKELGEDYTGGGSQKNNEVLQPEPPIGLNDVHVKRSKSVRTVYPRRVAKIIRPVIGDRDEMQVPANDSGNGGGSAEYAEGQTPKPEFRVIHTNENGGLNG